MSTTQYRTVKTLHTHCFRIPGVLR